jgi:UDP-N-acetylglucosamine:LPS N-acetylglucosamine transferase
MGTPRIDVVYFDAGSGHRSAAIALARALEADGSVRARPVELLELLRGHALFRRTVAMGIDYFNWWLRRERVTDLKGLINLSLLTHDLVSKRGVRAIASAWADDPPLAMVSVVPMYNPVLARALHLVRPHAPFIVVPVDFEEGKRRYWFDPRADLHYVLTTARQREQAELRGIPAERLRQASGMVIDPEFYAPPPADRAAALESLGLDPGLPTGLISFGGQGSVMVERCARALERVERRLNLMVLCGRDEKLRARLEALPSRHRRRVQGFEPAPPVLQHHLADFVVGKPGSMTITEAVVTGTPILALRARGLKLVQRGNERWVEEMGAGEVVERPSGLPDAVGRLLAQGSLRARLGALRHDGVFSAAAHILELAGHPGRLLGQRPARAG